jgi:hypothetical protein
MRIFSAVVLALCTTVLLGALNPNAKASEWDKKTVVTFHEPVEIPGHVLLPGTYVFSVEDTLSERNVVDVWSNDGTRLVATVVAVSATRNNSTDTTTFVFERRDSHSPEAIEDWFYPGDLNGEKFIYPTSLAPSPAVLR